MRFWTRIAGLFMLLSVGVLRAEDAGETRPFALGFTPFPYAINMDAVSDVYDKIATDADLIVHHFDNGIPWVEALAGDDYSDNILNDWALRSALTPDGHQQLVTITPISISRDSLAPYRGEQDDMPLPAPWDGYSFDHPDVIRAFTVYAEDVIDTFDPDYFLIGIEVNLLMANNPDLWDAYVSLHRAVYMELKANHPDLPVMVSLTGIDLLQGYTDADHADQMRALADIADYTDVMAWSLYPYLSAFMTNQIPTDIFDQLAELTDLPMAISETGYPAQSFRVGMGVDLQFDGTPELQADWISLALDAADAYNYVFVTNFVLQDYDDLWGELGAHEDLTILWRDTGLYDEDGAERPALAVWREWLARPLDTTQTES